METARRFLSGQTQPVTAPSEAEETIRAYFAITPLVYLGFGGFHFASRRLISAPESSMSR